MTTMSLSKRVSFSKGRPDTSVCHHRTSGGLRIVSARGRLEIFGVRPSAIYVLPYVLPYV